MSHTTKIGETTFIHNGGFDGDTRIRTGKGACETTFGVPTADLLGFAAEVVRQVRGSHLETADREIVLFGGRVEEGGPEVTEESD